MKKTLFVSAIALLAGCTAQPTLQEADAVSIMITHKPAIECTALGEIIGSQGHWYDALFTANVDLTQGAINDMKNQTSKLGGNTVFIDQQLKFTTSATFLGQAFRCPLTVKPNVGGVIF